MNFAFEHFNNAFMIESDDRKFRKIYTINLKRPESSETLFGRNLVYQMIQIQKNKYKRF